MNEPHARLERHSPAWRDDIDLTQLEQAHAFETAARRSTKIHDFFGVPLTESPAVFDSPTLGNMNNLRFGNMNNSRAWSHALRDASCQPDDADMGGKGRSDEDEEHMEEEHTQEEERRRSSGMDQATLVPTSSPTLKQQYYTTIKMHSRRTRWFASAVIQSCSPVWFTPPTALSTLALTLRLLPLAKINPSFLNPLSTALYLASLALYIPVSTLFLLRLALYPRQTHRATLRERDTSGLELGYLAQWPSGFVLLVSFGGFAVAEGRVGTTETRGGAVEGLAMAVYVCWWVGVVWACGVAVFVLACLLSTQGKSGSRTSGGRFAPLVGVLVCMNGIGVAAVVGGLLAWLRKPGGGGGVAEQGVYVVDVVAPAGGSGSIPGEGLFSVGLATPVVVFSLCVTGAAWFLAGLDYGVLLHELVLVMGWPPAEHTGTAFSMIGPLGQCGSAILMLSSASRRGEVGAFLGKGSTLQPRMLTGLVTMAPLEMVCVLLALLVAGMAVIWLLFGFLLVFYRLSRREVVWNPSWNGIVSPVASLAVLSILLSMELDSAFFRIAACVVIIACALMLLVNLGFTIRLAMTAGSRRDFSATGNNRVNK